MTRNTSKVRKLQKYNNDSEYFQGKKVAKVTDINMTRITIVVNYRNKIKIIVITATMFTVWH